MYKKPKTSNFAISLQYLSKVNDKVDFLHADKHESFLQNDTMICDWGSLVFQKFPNSKFAMSLQYLKKEFRDENDFLHVDKHQS